MSTSGAARHAARKRPSFLRIRYDNGSIRIQRVPTKDPFWYEAAVMEAR